MNGREDLIVARTNQVELVQQSLVKEMARDVYAERRMERRSLTQAIRLARIEVLLDEAIVELTIIRRDIRLMFKEAKETG